MAEKLILLINFNQKLFLEQQKVANYFQIKASVHAD